MLKRIGNLIRPALVLLAVFFVFGIAIVAYQSIRTLQQLDVVEAERDQWQRPADVIAALNLKSGNVAVDLGSGAGYFALKLSAVVGPTGRVTAVDLRRISLLFLRVERSCRENEIYALLSARPTIRTFQQAMWILCSLPIRIMN